jgi:hypothetical protein
MSKKSVNKQPVMSVYGNIVLERGLCPNCREMAFIKNGVYVCCDTPVDSEPKKYHGETEAPPHRHTPPKAEQVKILLEQEDRCFYCGVLLNSIRYRNVNPVNIRLAWDHQLPFVLTQNNQTSNFVAACHVCNGIKSDKVFRDIDEARVYLADKRMADAADLSGFQEPANSA